MSSIVEEIAAAGVGAVGLYLAVGSAVAAAFHWRGLGRIDPAARGAGPGFRFLITPGLVALWPWMLVVWRRASRKSGFPGGSATSPLPERLRGLQEWSWRILGLVVPVALLLFLASRPEESPPTRLPESKTVPFAAKAR